MNDSRAPSGEIHRRRLFLGICLALIPTGASFALVSNILVPSSSSSSSPTTRSG
jgi:hypothetical protein